MPTIRFTARTIAALPAPQAGQVDFWDRSLAGFGMRVSPTRRVWTVYYRHRGRKRRLTLGKYPDLPLATARDEAERKLHQIALGSDPAAEKEADRETFGDTIAALVEAYEKKASKKRSWKEERRILMKEIRPVWGPRLVRDITRRDVRELVEAKAETAPIMANRILSRLSRLFNYALENDWIDANPAHRVPKPARETSRDRVLTSAELAELWAALGETVAKDEHDRPLLLEDGRRVPRLASAVNDAFTVMLLTAQRSGEVCRMRWADVNLEKGWWLIHGTDTKNADEHRVPLTAPVVKLLTRRRAEADAAFEKQRAKRGREPVRAIYVFANGTGTRSIADRAKKGASLLSNGGLTFAFRAHDLRRTAASGMAEAGVPRDHIAHVLNHRSVTKSTVTAVYDRYTYDREKRAALETWARALTAATSGDLAKARVVTFSR